MSSTPQAILAFAKGEGSTKLTLKYRDQAISSGTHIPKADAPTPPTLKLINPSTAKYVAVSIDVDAPFESFNFLSPILHWVQTGLTADSDGTLMSNVEVTADWIQPAPPPFSGPHKYIVILYNQPADFELTKLEKHLGHPIPITKRIRFDLPAFCALAGLGEPVAASYFTSK